MTHQGRWWSPNGRDGRGAESWAWGTLRASIAMSRAGASAIIVVGLAASWLAIHLAGGADQMVPHAYYIPILFAAARFGPAMAVLVALVAGVLAGPMTYVDVAAGIPQELERWLTRTGFFLGIGLLMGWLVGPSLSSVGAEVRRVRQERDLRRGIEEGEFFLRYQPIVTLEDDVGVGVEALVRWQHPERGELAPAAFLPAAEACELINDLGAYVIEEACRQTAEWREVAIAERREPWFVSVNLSARELEAPGLVERVRRALDDSGLPPSLLCIEITESALVSDLESSVAQLHRLKKLGVRLGVDDFGTGYSSLSYLSRFPVDLLKVDRALIAELETDADAEALAHGLVLLATSLHLMTVAEGIETSGQGRAAAGLHYDLGQGYHYARPLLPSQVIDLLEGPGAPIADGRLVRVLEDGPSGRARQRREVG